MKLFLITAMVFSMAVSFSMAQDEPCGTSWINAERMKDPAVLRTRQAIAESAMNWMNSHARQSGTVVTVPVVFHIFHEDGAENLSKAQILDQLRVLNEDFRRMNSDTVNTPVPFQALAADCEIDFRLAQLDPNGDCTDGIVRVKTSLTNNATDDIKFLSTWDNDRYLNIWVVKSIYNFTGGAGTILGYAYYPGSAPPGVDGCIVRADYIGSTGFVSARTLGRTTTHEIGHYLDLAHVWGDWNCGNDQVNDTPPAHGPNYGCPSFPHQSAGCNTSPDGEMFVNYMDYTDDLCMNTFTAGQKQRMDATFAGWRSMLVSPANLAFTGVLNSPVACTMVPDFRVNRRIICAGDSVLFTDQSWNGDASSRQWNFSGGVTAPSADSILWVTFPNPGVYDAGITVSNAAGIISKLQPGYIIVKPAAMQAVTPYSESFDSNFSFALSGFDQYHSGTSFITTTNASFSGNTSLLRAYSVSQDDTLTTLVLPSLDFTGMSQPYLDFKIATGVRGQNSAAFLKVELSTNCGQTWAPRYIKRGLTLATVSGNVNGYVPISSDWRTETVSLSPAGNRQDVLVRITLSSGLLDNFYLDDINITGFLTSLNETDFSGLVKLYPNPTQGNLTLEIPEILKHREFVITDGTGRIVQRFIPANEINHIHLQNAAPGLYYLSSDNLHVKFSVR